MNPFKKISLLIAMMIVSFGCGSGGLSEEEQIIDEIENGTTFLLTDAPSDHFKSVMVDILSPIVVKTDQGEMSVPLPDNSPIRVDLLALDGFSKNLTRATRAVLGEGEIHKICLTLANPKITRLDNSIIGSNAITLTKEMCIIPAHAVIIPKDDGIVVEIDINVEASISTTTSTTTGLAFRPQGAVTQIKKDTHPNGVEASQIKGTIIEIGDNRFLMREHDRKFFVSVGVADAKFFELNKEIHFADLKIGQTVEVGGVVTYEKILKARRVVVLPSEDQHRAVRGIITNLNRRDRSFALAFYNLPEIGDTVLLRKIAVHYTDETPILLKRPHKRLSAGDLTDGQLVDIRGIARLNQDDIQAGLIIVEPEHFKAVIVSANCEAGQIQVLYPPREIARLQTADAALASDLSMIVEIGARTKLIGQDVIATLWCEDLKPGATIRISGQMLPPSPTIIAPSPINIEVFEIKEIPAVSVAPTDIVPRF